MKKIQQITLICIGIAHITPVHTEFLVSAAEGTNAAKPYEFALNIGPGWYTANSGLLTHTPDEPSTLSIFKSKTKTLAALVGELTVQPHQRCYINIVTGGAWLRNGTCFFIEKARTNKNCYDRVTGCEKASFDGNFFSINITTGLTYPITPSFELETSLGYSYDYGKLSTSTHSTFTYDTVGPVIAAGGTLKKNKFSCNATYSCIIGAYKERDHNAAENTLLILKFPNTFTNHVDVILQYEAQKNCNIGIAFSYDLFKNQGTGIAQSIRPQQSSAKYIPTHDVLTTILLLGFVSVSF